MRAALLEDGDIVPVAVAVVAGLLVARYLYLVSQRRSDLPSSTRPEPAEPLSPPSSLLPSSSGIRFWRTRKERVEADTAFVLSHTEFILARIDQAKAMGGLVRARLELAEIIATIRTSPAALGPSPPPLVTADFSLTLNEIEEMVAAVPDISPQLRQALMQLLSARLKEKVDD